MAMFCGGCALMALFYAVLRGFCACAAHLGANLANNFAGAGGEARDVTTAEHLLLKVRPVREVSGKQQLFGARRCSRARAAP